MFQCPCNGPFWWQAAKKLSKEGNLLFVCATVNFPYILWFKHLLFEHVAGSLYVQAVTVGDYLDNFPSLESDFGQEDLCPFRILSLETSFVTICCACFCWAVLVYFTSSRYGYDSSFRDLRRGAATRIGQSWCWQMCISFNPYDSYDMERHSFRIQYVSGYVVE